MSQLFPSSVSEWNLKRRLILAFSWSPWMLDQAITMCVFWHKHISTCQSDLICYPNVRVVQGRGQPLCSIPLSCDWVFFYFLIQATDARVHLYAICRQPVVSGCIFLVQYKCTQDICNFLLHSPCKSADALSGSGFRFATFRSYNVGYHFLSRSQCRARSRLRLSNSWLFPWTAYGLMVTGF